MFRKKLVLFGAGGHAVSCIDVIETTRRYELIGIYDQDNERKNSYLINYKILGNEQDFLDNPNRKYFALIAFGFIKNPNIRLNLINQFIQLGINCATVLSPFAYISKRASVGSGTIAMHGSTVNSTVLIGNHCIINSNALIEHGSLIGSNCHISTGAIINGDVNIGENCFIGSGAVLFPGVHVPNNSIIPAGAVIRN